MDRKLKTYTADQANGYVNKYRLFLVMWISKGSCHKMTVFFKITDYQSEISGIQEKHMRSHALPKKRVKMIVKQAIKEKTIVSYDLKHDLKALGLEGNRSAKWIDLIDFYENPSQKKKGLKEIVRNYIDGFLIVNYNL